MKNPITLNHVVILPPVSSFTGVSIEQTGIRHHYNNTRSNLMIGKNTKLICQGYTGKQVGKNSIGLIYSGVAVVTHAFLL